MSSSDYIFYIERSIQQKYKLLLRLYGCIDSEKDLLALILTSVRRLEMNSASITEKKDIIQKKAKECNYNFSLNIKELDNISRTLRPKLMSRQQLINDYHHLICENLGLKLECQKLELFDLFCETRNTQNDSPGDLLNNLEQADVNLTNAINELDLLLKDYEQIGGQLEDIVLAYRTVNSNCEKIRQELEIIGSE